ncbi:glutathione S-transferase family protein [Massilia endophytica]|uniref:glutathione S-transferase family protein n=1 Tax=Massilia endophytica TaxID=2899220 RepID=UPI001E5F8F14|nr:glutathione S-transferase family protein [Massilia endophytica]UGQ47538.1 glutathione S-transferase family protein [Massilia endophytica]
MPTLKLVSHKLCPYVQRAAIALSEKGIPFERVDIDLSNKPGWFLEVSPLGKTPVLLVGRQPVFESAVICEYLEDTAAPQLHPQDALRRAQHRGWIEFASAILNSIAGLYNAPDQASLSLKAQELRGRFRQLEAELSDGPYFEGDAFSLVDAAFAPVFRYFDVLDGMAGLHYFEDCPKLRAWREALRQRASVKDAVSAEYPQLLAGFLKARNSAVSSYIE